MIAHEVESLVEMTLLLTRVLASSFVRISSLFADLLTANYDWGVVLVSHKRVFGVGRHDILLLFKT